VLAIVEQHYLFGSQQTAFNYDIHQVLVVLTLEWDSDEYPSKVFYH
jgi:hypothetical protein